MKMRAKMRAFCHEAGTASQVWRLSGVMRERMSEKNGSFSIFPSKLLLIVYRRASLAGYEPVAELLRALRGCVTAVLNALFLGRTGQAV